jgi:ppGpp synthetase/RelA/SpoT-type nucleotidyltranferase
MVREARRGGRSAAREVMEWAIPQYSRADVDRAGRTLVHLMGTPGTEWTDAYESEWWRSTKVINNWRSAHAYPLNTFQNGLRSKSRKIDPNAVVAQRTKRLWSIWHKLDRFKTMQLAQIQDIGGCRAILGTAEQVRALVHAYEHSSLRHSRRVTDYMTSPRQSGYRGVHIIWKYRSDKPTKESYNGLQIEMQIRSVLQHAWATSVETIGTLTRQALKSSLGEQDWLRFFALMGSVIALQEGAPGVPLTPTNRVDLVRELREYSYRISALSRLRAIGNLHVLDQSNASGAHLFLLEMTGENLRVTGFRASQQKEAQDSYSEREASITRDENSDAVLVSVDSLSSLRKAYPNYFLDASVFADVLEAALSDDR